MAFGGAQRPDRKRLSSGCGARSELAAQEVEHAQQIVGGQGRPGAGQGHERGGGNSRDGKPVDESGDG